MAVQRRSLFRLVTAGIFFTLLMVFYEFLLIHKSKDDLSTTIIKLKRDDYPESQRGVSPYSLSLSQSICHKAAAVTYYHSSRDSLHRLLVVGASNYIGQSVTRIFTNIFAGIVAPTEEDTVIFSDPVSWYRWEELIHEGHNPQFVNYSDHYITQKFIQNTAPSIIMYVPTPAIEKSLVHSPTAVSHHSFNSFLSLLEVVKNQYPPIQVCLLSLEHKWNKWMKPFELALSSYSWLYSIKISVIRIKNVFGALSLDKHGSLKKACYVDDLVVFVLESVMNQQSMCRVYDMRTCTGRNKNGERNRNRDAAYQAYLNQQTRSIVMTTYFTTQLNAQYTIEFLNNNFYFMENWFTSTYKLNLHMVIFHDDLSEVFIETFTKNCPNIEFVKIHSFEGYTPNDRRYFVYYDYLLAHSDVGYALMTDMRDVKLINSPFTMMDTVGDFVYFGLDMPFHETSVSSNIVKSLPKCYTHYPENILNLYGNLNPGVLGGKRKTMLSALRKYIQFIEVSSKRNCNTPAASYLFHTMFYESLFFGWPFQSGFMTDQPHPPGLCVLHKWNNESW